MAIKSVMHILLNYDTDKMIPTYGFGGVPSFQPPRLNSPQVSHFFPCSGDWASAEVYGVDGVFEVYNYAIHNVRLSGPTYFAPLLQECFKFTQDQYKIDPYNYSVLLILTDGWIHDMDLTKDWLVRMSGFPISVIIVGIGNEDFSKMEALDSDGELLSASCGMAQRDIVQFVPFNKFNGDPGLLAAEVLREVPGQVTGFYKSKKLAPKPPVLKDVKGIGAGNFDRTGNLMDEAYMQARKDFFRNKV
jgi:hypothetical protein